MFAQIRELQTRKSYFRPCSSVLFVSLAAVARPSIRIAATVYASAILGRCDGILAFEIIGCRRTTERDTLTQGGPVAEELKIVQRSYVAGGFAICAGSCSHVRLCLCPCLPIQNALKGHGPEMTYRCTGVEPAWNVGKFGAGSALGHFPSAFPGALRVTGRRRLTGTVPGAPQTRRST
jgi:hypothetical protein